ncbi:hypothetical protein BDQ17DRAFT_1370280 [Cyathus striatus]|nr:hypothetical protein BDQ17DRAFT_1370280 [Cyathus striatus]
MSDPHTYVVLPWRKLLDIIVPGYSSDLLYLSPATEKEIGEHIKPLTDILNAIVGVSSMVFCRNGLSALWGSPAERKPSILGVHEKSLRIGTQARLRENQSQNGSSEDPFHWSELLIFLEVDATRELHVQIEDSPQEHATRTTETNRNGFAPNSTINNDTYLSSEARETSSNYTSSTYASSERNEHDNAVFNAFSNKMQEKCASYAQELLSYGGLHRYVLGIFIHDEICQFLYYDRSAMIKSEPFYWLNDIQTFEKIIYSLARLDYGTLGFETVLKGVAYTLANGSLYRPVLPNPRHEYERYKYKDLFMDSILEVDDMQLSLKDTIHQRHGILGRGMKIIRARATNGEHRNMNLVVKMSYIPQCQCSEAEIIKAAQETAALNENTFKQLRIECSEYRLRDLRILVMEELFPITQLTDGAAKFGKVFREIFECHYWLYSQLNILHYGDVIYGVLNDFDLSRRINDYLSEPLYRQRIGTIPFVAMELLHSPETAPAHLYRHDVESFFYVFYYIITSYDKNALISNPPLEWWFTDAPSDVSKGKSQDFFLNLHHGPTPTFRAFEDSSREMFDAIRDGYYMFRSTGKLHRMAKGDIETMKGNISYEKISTIFTTIGSL